MGKALSFDEGALPREIQCIFSSFSQLMKLISIYFLISMTIDGNVELDLVRNTRELGSASPVVRPRIIYRTACPANASVGDVEAFSDHLGIHLLIDLRSEEEQEEDDENGALAGSITVDHLWRRSKKNSRALEATVTVTDKTGSKSNTKRGTPPFIRHRLSLLDRKRFYRALLGKLPKLVVAKALFISIYDGQASKDLFLDEINKGGLELLYEIILETSQPEILETLKLITTTAETGNGVLFYCKAGKDRTGLLAMLILGLLGATESEIVADFTKSDKHQQVALGGMEKRPELKRLKREIFARAPPEAMRHTLRWLHERYQSSGRDSFVAYCNEIGFNPTWQKRLTLALKADQDKNDG